MKRFSTSWSVPVSPSSTVAWLFSNRSQSMAKWKSPEGEQVLSCTILTCGPNGAMGELHDRMPVILDVADWPKWLGEAPATEDDPQAARGHAS